MAVARILLQSTIPFAENDWHIGRFTLLAAVLRAAGHQVTCRNREPREQGDDPLLATVSPLSFSQIWLFGADTDNGLTLSDVRGINIFRTQGGGLLTARDHQDLGLSLRGVATAGSANYFHTEAREPDLARCVNDDRETPTISWPNYHSGANGDFQRIQVVEPMHPVFRRQSGGPIEYFPAHPHEGAIGIEQCGGHGRIIAVGASRASSRIFNLVAAFEPRAKGDGRVLVHSSFHHFADCNWDPRSSKPTFVTEPSRNGMLTCRQAADDIRDYVINAAQWLAGNTA